MADIQAAKINHDNHLLLDQSCLRLPYELLRQNFRSFHVPFDKNHNAVKDLLKDTANGSLNGKASPEDVVKNLDQMLVKMRGLKRKLTTAADEENRLYRQMNARVSHLRDLAELNTVDDVKYEAWSRQRLDRLLVDYMLRHGYDASAIALADERGMQDLVDIDTFVTMSKIRKSLEGGSVQEALAWCGENKKELRKMQSNLEFMLRCQQYIEMMRTGTQAKMLEAINHARKHITPFSESYPLEVSNMAGLLACQPDTDLEPYASFYNASRWAKLAEAFVEAYLKLLNLPMTPLLHIALQSGLSALKTPACHSNQTRSEDKDQAATTNGTSSSSSSSAPPHHRHHHRHHPPQPLDAPNASANGTTTSNTNPPAPHPHPHHGTASLTTRVCPICSTELNALARGVRYAHHTKSRLLEHDLVLLPNGRVYGRARLNEHAAKSGLVGSGGVGMGTGTAAGGLGTGRGTGAQVKDLVTGEVFKEEEIKKVFVT